MPDSSDFHTHPRHYAEVAVAEDYISWETLAQALLSRLSHDEVRNALYDLELDPRRHCHNCNCEEPEDEGETDNEGNFYCNHCLEHNVCRCSQCSHIGDEDDFQTVNNLLYCSDCHDDLEEEDKEAKCECGSKLVENECVVCSLDDEY